MQDNSKIEKSLIVQSDRSIMVETSVSNYDNLRDFLLKFAELIKTPNYFHTYRITNISLWNAASCGITSQEILSFLDKNSKYPIPANIQIDIQNITNRFGEIILDKDSLSNELILLIKNDDIAMDLEKSKNFKKYISSQIDFKKYIIKADKRGSVKQFLISLGYPVQDVAGYNNGEILDIEIFNFTKSNKEFKIRDYQINAINSFYQDGSVEGGSGVLLLPCGAGKTIIAIGVMELHSQETLIICSSTVAVKQWISEIIDKTNIDESLIGEYSSSVKEIKPITVTTYQILCWRKEKKSDNFPHMNLFMKKNWGLIIYDEVHLLPAPVFRETANLQAIRRLGLTATLIREDGFETDVFTLIGPIKYNVPWLKLQEAGWIATVECFEVRTKMDQELKSQYYSARARSKYRIAAENPKKFKILKNLLEKHADDKVLIIAQYKDQLKKISELLDDKNVVSGQTPNKKRIELYSKFETGILNKLIVSKVANYAIDLPSANVMIQLSGTFGSRQEEAQRLGRILRQKEDGIQAYFYTIVTTETIDEEYAQHRQLFLIEQGYQYNILYAE